MKEKFQFRGSAADAKKELYADLRDRRAEASGARHKKNGSKKKRLFSTFGWAYSPPIREVKWAYEHFRNECSDRL